MAKGISLHSVVPMRAEAREGAEQSTQMLFGELCQVQAKGEGLEANAHSRWRYVRLESDGQEGWADAKMITPMSDEEYAGYAEALKTSAMVAFPMAYAVSENNGQTIPLTAGTRLTNYKDGRFEVLGVGFRIDPSMVITQPMALNEQNLLQAVRFFLNVPYQWGGKNAMGMDCSGFAQVIMGLFGKKLLRNAIEQATQGEPVEGLENVKAGDLAFFNHGAQSTEHGTQNTEHGTQNTEHRTQNTEHRAQTDSHVSHVGIVIDKERVIHCSGRVKVEKLDEKGIFSAETGDYSHLLVSIRRV